METDFCNPQLDSEFWAVHRLAEKTGDEVLIGFVEIFQETATAKSINLRGSTVIKTNSALRKLWEEKCQNTRSEYFAYWRYELGWNIITLLNVVTDDSADPSDIYRNQEGLIGSLNKMVTSYK